MAPRGPSNPSYDPKTGAPYLFGFTSRLIAIHFPGISGATGAPAANKSYQGYYVYQPTQVLKTYEWSADPSPQGSWPHVPGLDVTVGYDSVEAAIKAGQANGPFTSGEAANASVIWNNFFTAFNNLAGSFNVYGGYPAINFADPPTTLPGGYVSISIVSGAGYWQSGDVFVQSSPYVTTGGPVKTNIKPYPGPPIND
jgi:hypothetical protein